MASCRGRNRNHYYGPLSTMSQRPGSTIDVSFKVALEGIPAGANSVYLMQEQGTVLISRDILEYLKIAKPAEAKTEEERMATLHGRRAEILLNNLRTSKMISAARSCSLLR